MAEAEKFPEDLSIIRFASARAREIGVLTNLIGTKYLRHSLDWLIFILILFRKSENDKTHIPETTMSYEEKSNESQSKTDAQKTEGSSQESSLFA